MELSEYIITKPLFVNLCSFVYTYAHPQVNIRMGKLGRYAVIWYNTKDINKTNIVLTGHFDKIIIKII